MLKSKRFLITVISFVSYLIGVYFFHAEPLSFATGIGIILAPYLAAQAYRASDKTVVEPKN